MEQVLYLFCILCREWGWERAGHKVGCFLFGKAVRMVWVDTVELMVVNFRAAFSLPSPNWGKRMKREHEHAFYFCLNGHGESRMRGVSISVKETAHERFVSGSSKWWGKLMKLGSVCASRKKGLENNGWVQLLSVFNHFATCSEFLSLRCQLAYEVDELDKLYCRREFVCSSWRSPLKYLGPCEKRLVLRHESPANNLSVYF